MNRRTAIEPRSGAPTALLAALAMVERSWAPKLTWNARTGRSMFFSDSSPRSLNSASTRLTTESWAIAEMTTPPGSAIPSSLAATFTPSPKMSASSMMTSPTLMPIRNSRRRSCGKERLRSRMPVWTSSAQRVASTTLPNSIRRPSPVVLTMRPRCSAILRSRKSRRWARSAASVPSSSAPMSRL